MIFVKDVITARKNPTVMRVASLLEKKGREEHAAFIAEGIKLFQEAVRSKLPIESIFVNDEKKSVIYSIIEKELANEKYSSTKIYTLSDSCFEKITTEKSPQGIIVVIKYLDFFKSCNKIIEKAIFEEHKKSIILSSMRDPGNLGSVIRSAVAFGAERIILSSDCADVYNPKTIRAAMGSLFKVEIISSDDLVRTVNFLREGGVRVFAAELRDNAVSVDEMDLSPNDIVVIGNEGHGIDEELSSACNGSVYIPIAPLAESLNASVAAAIFMREQKIM